VHWSPVWHSHRPSAVLQLSGQGETPLDEQQSSLVAQPVHWPVVVSQAPEPPQSAVVRHPTHEWATQRACVESPRVAQSASVVQPLHWPRGLHLPVRLPEQSESALQARHWPVVLSQPTPVPASTQSASVWH
jgi:hypothetical protein